jgi:hypothetical protein
VAKFLTTSIQNANLARAKTRPPFRVVEEQASQIQKVSTQLEATKSALPNGQQSLKAAPAPPKQQHFTISRHASPRGGFLFHA